jgi:hypothetical protein
MSVCTTKRTKFGSDFGPNFVSHRWEGVLKMKRRTRIHHTDAQKTLMSDRWQKGESMQDNARLFDRYHSSVQRLSSRRKPDHDTPFVFFYFVRSFARLEAASR